MTVHEMKQILAEKLKDENSSFTYKDIHIKAHPTNSNELCWDIWIEGYEHCKFKLKEILSGEEKGLFLWDSFEGDYVFCAWTDFHTGQEVTSRWYRSALVNLGYTIANEF